MCAKGYSTPPRTAACGLFSKAVPPSRCSIHAAVSSGAQLLYQLQGLDLNACRSMDQYDGCSDHRRAKPAARHSPVPRPCPSTAFRYHKAKFFDRRKALRRLAQIHRKLKGVSYKPGWVGLYRTAVADCGACHQAITLTFADWYFRSWVCSYEFRIVPTTRSAFLQS